MATWNDHRARVILAVVLAASPACFVFGFLRPRALAGTYTPSYDFYAYFYPNVLHTIRSLQEGFGLFWNPYQNCGQPFFAYSLTGLLYPPNLVFFVLDREAAVMASMVLNLTLGGLGVWLLLRELKLGVAAAFAGAIAFEVSGTALMLGGWSPMHIGPYVWMPWAMFCLERILREPSHRHGIALAATLAVQLLPGFPIISLFTVQLVGLRVLWALAAREVERPTRLVVPLALGLLGAALLVAVQYVPSMQVAMESVRSAGLDSVEILHSVAWLDRPGLATAALAAAALFGRRHRRVVWFYLALGSIFAILSLGDRTPLFEIYTSLPLGDLFVRRPGRFLWVTSFALSVLVAVAVDEFSPSEGSELPRRRTLLVAAMVGGAIAMSAIPVLGPVPLEWIGAALALALAAFAASRLPGHALAPWVMVAVLAASGLYVHRAPYLNLRAGSFYNIDQPTFSFLGDRITPQARVLINTAPGDVPLVKKSASIFRVPAIGDYEPQTSRRFAEYTVRMNHGRPMLSLNDLLYYPTLRAAYARPLANLAAARYFVAANPEMRKSFGPGFKEIHNSDEVTVYENLKAMPRAMFVPALRVLPRAQLLEQLSEVRHRPGRVALVEQAPASGFLGTPGIGGGSVEFAEDRGERVVLKVTAKKPGFVTLTDQYFPGWVVKVNGKPAEILRANYAFRAVEVPAGESEVVFEYELTIIYLGGAISLFTLGSLCWLWRRESQLASQVIKLGNSGPS